MPGRAKVNKERKHFDTIASSYDNMFGFSAKKRRRKTDWIVKSSHLSSKTNVLELGCGTGLSTGTFAETQATIHAIDVSFRLLRIANSLRHYQNVCYEVADVEILPFPTAFFDAVIGTFVLHHFNMERALTEIHRVCKPGAWISFSEPNMLNPVVFAIKHVPWIKRMIGDSPDETAFIRRNLARVLEEHLFGDIKIEPIEFLPPGVPKTLAPAINKVGHILEKIPLIREFGGTLLICARKL